MSDALNAFIDPSFTIAGAVDGPLAGLSLAVKDLYAIAGRVTGAGNPDWCRTHAAASETAPVVQALLNAGASVKGITHLDELAFSMNGRNFHYGTPINTAAPDRIPGGSSSGSAAAVAGRVVDLGLGTDTGGSVRVPASHCGIFGFRPTHGRIPTTGLVPLAPCFDTVGWFARTPQLLAAVGEVLLPPDETAAPAVGGLLVAEDILAEADPAVGDAFAQVLAALQLEFGTATRCPLVPLPLAEAFEATRILMVDAVKRGHGDWIRTTKPTFGPGLAQRFQAALEQPDALVRPAMAVRKRVAAHLRRTLSGNVVAVMPTVSAPPPRRDDSDDVLEAYRFRMQRVTCPAGLAGAPQINIPAMRVGGAPVGLALVAAPGTDRLLLAMAARVAAALPVDVQ